MRWEKPAGCAQWNCKGDRRRLLSSHGALGKVKCEGSGFTDVFFRDHLPPLSDFPAGGCDPLWGAVASKGLSTDAAVFAAAQMY